MSHQGGEQILGIFFYQRMSPGFDHLNRCVIIPDLYSQFMFLDMYTDV